MRIRNSQDVWFQIYNSKYFTAMDLLFYLTGNMFSTYKRSWDSLDFCTSNAAECELDLQKDE